MAMTSDDRLEIQVAVDGVPIPGLLRASVATTNSFSADTFSLTFSTGSRVSSNIGFWSSVPSACLTVTAVSSRVYGRTYQDLITGMIDTIHVNPIQGTVTVDGRDLSSLLIDAYRQQDFVNQTASEIVSTIAQYHDLRPVVTATTENIGRYYGDGHTKLSLGQFSRIQSDWDLVVQLARLSNFDVFVQAKSLHFRPASRYTDSPVFIDLRDMKRVRIERNLNTAASTTATVQSWNSRNMAAYQSSSVSEPAAANAGPPSGAKPSFLFSGSNYTSGQVSDLAGRYAAELGRLTTILEMDMPWDLSLSPRTVILLSNTDSSFDTTYQIDSIERHYSSTSGSAQALRAAQISAIY
jgi:hypothetical protein